MPSRRWDSDERGHGIGDASSSVPAIQRLAELAVIRDWVAEEPETHLVPGLRGREAASGLTITSAEIAPDGALHVHLASTARLSKRELRQAIWTMLGAVAELTTHVNEVAVDGVVNFDVVTGIPPGAGTFATHGHTLRLQVKQPD